MQVLGIAPGEPFFFNGHDISAVLGDLIGMLPEIAFHIPAQALYAVAGAEKAEFSADGGYLILIYINLVAGHPGEQFLLDESHFPAMAVVDMELFAPGKNLTLHSIPGLTVQVADIKLVAPRKYPLFYV